MSKRRGGYPRSMALATGLAGEYRVLTEGCALVDRSDRGKLALTGSDAKSFLQGQTTNDVEALTPGRGCYAAFLTAKGKMLGDLRVIDSGEELWLDTERVALQPLFNMINAYKLAADVVLHKRTLEQALFSLIGPQARVVAGAKGLGAGEHDNGTAEIRGVAALLVATDTGVDVICAAERAHEMRAALVAGGAEEVSPAAAEMLRVERGRPRYGKEMDEATIPQEAGINDRAVSFEKGCYVGQETVARLHYRGKPNRRLRGLALSEPGSDGEELWLAERAVGTIGTAVVSPRLGPIALALVRREAAPGDTLRVAAEGRSAMVVELPFDAV
ncbi:MAG TPA: glycine cleavage T C-terminal barrel domain-containing protein [Solirubrobacteraceae bacterium]|nr:glycine cleavage T C-terminal barrel domain-containing protein [Solirubrobacteraceae bacterium]